MLKRFSVRKISLASAALLTIVLLYVMPATEERINPLETLEYVDVKAHTNPIFLMDQNSYVARTEVVLTDGQIEAKARELISILTVGGIDSKIPSGFSAIIPPDTRILSLEYEKGLIKVNFSADLLDIDIYREQKMIEALVYTLTSIDDVNKVIIYVEGEILTKLPKTKENLPSTLDRTFGINKEYNFSKVSKINDVTVYYVNRINDKYYYVPVTKYLNDDRDKIKIVIDQLKNSITDTNLMSFLNSDAKLVSSTIKNDVLNLEFNEAIFDDINTKEILEEVIYTISLSAYDNYNVKEVVFKVGNEEICAVNSTKNTCTND